MRGARKHRMQHWMRLCCNKHVALGCTRSRAQYHVPSVSGNLKTGLLLLCTGRGGMDQTPRTELATARCRAADNTHAAPEPGAEVLSLRSERRRREAVAVLRG